MKIVCISNTGEHLSDKLIEIGYTKDMKFDLDLNCEYMVYGIGLLENEDIQYLILDKNQDKPSWYTAELFKVSDPLLPLEFYFGDHSHIKTTTTRFIWGYKELVLEANHDIDLINREPEALKIFLKRKAEIHEFMDF